MLLLRSVGIGLSAAIALGALAFAAASFFDAVGLFFTPAKLTVPVTMFFAPRLIYELDPDGGPGAGVLVVLASAIWFWSVVFAVTYFVSATLRRKHAAKSTMMANS